jgi:TolB protein
MTENRRAPRLPSARKHLALTVGVLVLALSAGPVSALAAPMAPAARPRPAAVVPWSKAGPGWTVTVYSTSSAPGVTPVVQGVTTLYLTSPQGAKYKIAALAASAVPYHLLDWSGDRQRALLWGRTAPSARALMEQVSLVTGRVVSKFTLPGYVTPIGYTRPDGLNLLALRLSATSTQVVRYNLAGQQQVVLASMKSVAGVIDSPDGSSVIIGTSSGLEQVANSGGGTPTRFPAPVPVTGCGPVRWWNASTVLAWCSAKGPRYYLRLWLFPVNGGKVTALTPQREGHGPDYGDQAAWRLSTGRLYLQYNVGRCGPEGIGWQWQNETLHPVTVPDAANYNQIITGSGRRLLIQAVYGCPGRYLLLWFDPITSAVQYVLNTPANTLGVIAVVPFGRPLTS